MAEPIGNMIADSLQLALNYAARLKTDITPEQFGRFAAPGGQVVESNHPAFIFGHLALYVPQIWEQLNLTDSPVDIPENFWCLFSKDAKCQDDPNGTIYPPSDTLLTTFFRGYEHVRDAFRTTPDEIFQTANPLEGRLAELFPTIGSLHTFYAGGHVMTHLGQLSAWRRMMGLGPA